MDGWFAETKGTEKLLDPFYHIEVSSDSRYRGRHGTSLDEPYKFIFTIDEKPYKDVMVTDSAGQPFLESGNIDQ